MFGRGSRATIVRAMTGWPGRAAAGIMSPLPVERHGPPAVAFARRLSATRDDMTIEPLETIFRSDDTDLLVRAWLRIPGERVPSSVLANMDVAARAFGSDPLMQTVFFLSVSYGLDSREIADQLGLSRRRSRAVLRRAIAQLDRAARQSVAAGL
ncbi:hypothetical protein Q4F19_13410 [Sphingomonas sp. BIUV-7]|uniref:RNA polymerase sigma factor 70 region 4 type 2 domain-containing protein n=1 Tax=Sphingomonas natans TaxID=3063330 RepID=A0ABT8YAP2_9SPHN|nr:hypothetical protein [Sphingomonas sp. BIUV-7]MDO6415385.1 hypothetical protein [Sphingomonas sp. BIUV-7]